MRRRWRFLSSALGVTVAWLVTVGHPAPLAALPQSRDQRGCLDDMNKRGYEVAREQGKANHACVRDAAAGAVSRLGTPPQVQTAQACLSNDVKGRVAKRLDTLADREVKSCLSEPGQLPGFAYTGAGTVGTAAVAGSRALMAALFGSNLDAAVVRTAVDRDGAACQADVVRYANKLHDTVWKEALSHQRDVLSGKDRLLTASPTPIAGALELQAEVETYVERDPRGRIARATETLLARAERRCAEASTPLPLLFPGGCPTTDVTALASCAAGRARAQFFAAFDAFDDLAVDCDRTDDGTPNLSCESPALRAHVLSRIGYGPDAWSMTRIQTLGIVGYIQEQLSPATIDDSAVDAALASAYPSLAMSFAQLRASYPQNGNPGLNQVRRELQHAKFLRAIAARRQLQEVLVDVFMNHLNVDAASSARTKWDINPYDRLVIRPHVLGRFADLLLASARSPAMGDYLDNRRSRVDGLNENYGRELLELHTYGVDGPYDETDVVEVARCFTGWREDYTQPDGFAFTAAWHDQGSKTLFGGTLQIPANGGEQDGITVINHLAVQPATATFVSQKLVRRFVNETPPEALVTAAANRFLSTGGDLRAVMETILLSPEFLHQTQHRRAKVKRPHHVLASVARALGADPLQVNLPELRRNAESLGEAVYEAAPPTGYPDTSGFWASPGTIVTRLNEIERRARGLDGFVFTYPVSGGTAEEVTDALIALLIPGGVSTTTRVQTIAFVQSVPLGDPDRVAQAAAVLLSAPEFLLH